MPINLFDASYYRSANSDLQGLNDQEVLSHFQSEGLNAGRLFSPYVNLSFYRAANPDLGEFSNSQLYDHLSSTGIGEGRKFSALIDLNFYRSANADLTNFSNEELFTHLITSGVSEGRVFSTVFDVNYYFAVNPDVSQFYGGNRIEGLKHYTIYGLQEGRNASISFDVNSYRNSNLDLGEISNQDLLNHFQISGLDGGRIATDKFDVRYYLQQNPDLSNIGFNYRQAYEHFTQYGLKEGRNASNLITSDFAGNNFETAREIAISSNLTTVRDAVGSGDTADIYRLSIGQEQTNLRVELNGLGANIDLQLLGSDGTVLATSLNSENSSEVIEIQALGTGTYYLQIYPSHPEAVSNYNLSFFTTLVADNFQSNQTIPVTTESPSPSSQLHAFIQQVLNLTNAERTKAGLSPLKLNSQLTQAAQLHSEDMANSDYFSHQGYNGSSVGDRIYASGYKYTYAAENIAAGQTTPEEVVQAWMNSPGHRKNIMSSKYEEIGIGYYYLAHDTGDVNYNYYWTQNFGAA